MIEYNDIKNIIIYNDPLIGYMTLDEIFNCISYQITNQKKFEKIVYSILESTSLDKEDIATILSLSTTNNIETYIKIIKDEL